MKERQALLDRFQLGESVKSAIGHFASASFSIKTTPDDFIEVDQDLHTVSGAGMANPATRFHLWVYESRPDVHSIVHTLSPCTSVLAAANCLSNGHDSFLRQVCVFIRVTWAPNRGPWGRDHYPGPGL